MKQYSTVREIQNDSTGHFFDESAKRFFNSRILQQVYRGVYFITTERFDMRSPRLFTIRMSINGKIETIGKFQQFETKRRAEKFIESLPEYFPQAYEAASNEFNGKPLQGMDFVSLALIEPSNHPKQEFTTDTFTGACTWLIKNYKDLDMPFVQFFADKFNERIKEEA